MPSIEAILRQINKDLVAQFEEKLRASLAEQDKEWLIEQIVRLTLDKHSLEEMDRRHVQEEEHRKRQERAERQFHRTQRQLLILTVPRMKSDPLDFMRATTELRAEGKWQDSNGGTDDRRADNVVLEIEYGEMEGNQIGDGIVSALRLINLLEINEEVLYGRIEKVEQSTLVS